MIYYDIIHDNPSGLWPLDRSAGSIFSDVSGFDNDAVSSEVVNLIPNPSMELAQGNVGLRTNYVNNPNFETSAANWLKTHSSGPAITRSTTSFERGTASGLIQSGAYIRATALPNWRSYFGSLYINPLTTGPWSLHVVNSPASTDVGVPRRYAIAKKGAGVVSENSAVNLFVNPTPIVDTSGWGILNGTSIARDTTKSYAGTASVKMTRSTTFEPRSIRLDYTHSGGKTIPLQVGTYTISAWVWGPTGQGATSGQIEFESNTSYSVGTVNSSTAAPYNGTWQRTTQTFTVTQPGQAVFNFRDLGTLAVNDIVYVDAIQLEKGSVATSFVHGSLGTGYSYDTTTNILTNSGFETGNLTGWSTYGNHPVSTVKTTNPRGGTYTNEIAPLAGHTGYVGMQSSVTSGATASTYYTLSAYLRRAAGTGDVSIGIEFLDVNSVVIGAASFTSTLGTLTSIWNRISHTAKSPAGTDKIRAIVRYTTFTGGVDILFVDDVQLEARSYPTPYGNLGTQGNAPSTRAVSYSEFTLPATYSTYTCTAQMKVTRLPYSDSEGQQFITPFRLIGTGSIYPHIMTSGSTYAFGVTNDTQGFNTSAFSLAIGDTIGVTVKVNGSGLMKAYVSINGGAEMSVTGTFTAGVTNPSPNRIRTGHYGDLANRALGGGVVESVLFFDSYMSDAECIGLARQTSALNNYYNRTEAKWTAFINETTYATTSAYANAWNRIQSGITALDKSSTVLDLVLLGREGEQAYIDSALLEQGSRLRPYFDGSTTQPLNIARRGTVTPGSVADSSKVTDGSTTSSAYYQNATNNVIVDMGVVEEINQVKVWHYYSDSRTYTGSKTEVSADNVNWTTVFDSAVSGTYVETSAGHTIDFEPMFVRYIRDTVTGSNANAGMHWVEIQAYDTNSPFVHSWSGTANLSTSTTVAPSINYWTGNGYRGHYRKYSPDALSGNYVLHVDDDKNGDSASAAYAATGLTPGQTYTFSAYYKLKQGTPASPRIKPVSTTNITVVSNPIITMVKDEWVRAHITFIPAVTSLGSYLDNITLHTGAPGVQFEVDQAMLEQSATLSPYVDGNSENALWSGTPHNSTSVSTNLNFAVPVTAGGVASIIAEGSKTLSFTHPSSFIAGKESRPFSLEFWFRSDNSSGTFTFGRDGMGVILTGDRVEFNLGGLNVIGEYVTTGEPHHVVAILSGDVMTLWLDGELVATQQTEALDFSTVTAPAISASTTGARVVGLDTVAIYDSPLDAEAIRRHEAAGSDYFSVSNNAAGQDSISIKFDDLSLPVAKQEVNEYGPLLTNLVQDGNRLVQVFDPETEQYLDSEYTHLLQFDNLEYGTAAQARIDWDVIGDPSRVTVESSTDNVTWAPVTNHGMTTNWNDLMDGNDYFLRVSISAGLEQISIENLAITMYSSLVYTSSDVNVNATVVGGTATPGYSEAHPTMFRNREGVKLSAASNGIRIDTHADFGNIQSVELIAKSLSAYGTIIENGSSRVWRDASGLHYTGFSNVIIDGVSYEDDDPADQLKTGWNHMVAVFSSPNNNLTYIGARADGTGDTEFQVSHIALHRAALDEAQAEQLYKTYVGEAPVRITEDSIPPITEHVYSNGEIYRMYSFDWSIVGGG